MVVLFKKGELLYAKCKLNLKKPIKYQNKVFKIGEQVELLLPEEVISILTENGNIKIWNGKKFIKLNLGQFSDIVMKKLFRVKAIVEQVKEKEVVIPKVEVKPQTVVKETKVEVKPQQPVVEKPINKEVKEEVAEEKENVENKKKRHKQNQGGDK